MNSWNILNFAYLNNGKKSSLRDKMICILFSFACSKERLDGDIKTECDFSKQTLKKL